MIAAVGLFTGIAPAPSQPVSFLVIVSWNVEWLAEQAAMVKSGFWAQFKAQGSADQRLFALFLSGAELTLHAAVYGAEGAERQMLVEALDLLGPDDVLVLDLG